MSVTVKVNGSSNSIVHKGSNGIAKSTAPDVCKTPSPGGPVPIPYPVIISMASDLAKGSTTVKADGEMIGIKGCEFSMCTGDEAGTAGGGVVSSTFKKEAKFILFSMDVKINGKNACRLGDKMTMNHQNTFCMGGVVQFPVEVVGLEEQLKELARRCNEKVNQERKKKKKPKGKECSTLGVKKHTCCEKAIKKHTAENGTNPILFGTGFARGAGDRIP